MIGISAVFLGFFLLNCCFRPVSAQDILIEDEVQDMQKTFPLPDGSSRNDADYCSGSKNNELMDKHYLLVSTMDGKIKALDVKNNGKVLWIMDTDHSPLLEGTLNSYQLMYEGHPAVLVPSLDGSLYMYTVDSNALKPLRMNADISSMIGDDAVAGGSIVSTTGVDPITGKEKYSCSSLNCEKRKGSDCSFHTLVIRRNTQTVRAANPATGSERWNLSVAEYALSLISSDPVFKYVPNEPTANIAVRLRPPDGVVMALNNCGRTLWEVDLESPIARAWQMFNGHLEEVSLFDSENLMLVESPSGRFTDNSGLPKYEAAFYFGTVNAEPYIIPSETVRTEMQRFNMPRDSAYHATHGVDFTHPRALFLNDLALSSFLRRSYENTMNVHGIENENYFDSTKQQDACPYTDAQPLAHSTELQQVGLGNENRAGDLGWYVFKPLSDLKRKSSSSINGRVLPMKSLNANDRCDEDSFYNYNSIELLLLSLIIMLLTAVLSVLFVIFSTFHNHFSTDKNIGGTRPALNAENQKKFTQASLSLTAECQGSSSSKVTLHSSGSQSSFKSKFLDDFIPIKCLGRGGFGVVFKCKHRLDDAMYAVKRIAVSHTATAIERVKREAKAMAKLDHPGIIRYYHTWMETPPPGWQQETDRSILHRMRDSIPPPVWSSASRGIQKINPELCKESEGDSSPPKSAKSIPMNRGDHNISERTDSGSWADTRLYENDLLNTSVAENPLFASSSKQETVNEVNVAEESLEIIFDDGTKSHSLCGPTPMEPSNTALIKDESFQGPLEPSAVLIASDTDLMTCRRTKDYIYLYIQMELCEEFTLFNWLQAHSDSADRNLDMMRNWIAQLVCAIGYIHERGMIHRDLKPHNIFFSTDDQRTLKIGDLGLVTTYVDDEETHNDASAIIYNHTGNVGTRCYMSPEQLRGEVYNEKVDIFSLGLIFAEMLIPFKTMMERNITLADIQNGRLPSEALKSIPEEAGFIKWLTNPDPNRRPSCDTIAQSDYLKDEIAQLGIPFVRNRSLWSMLGLKSRWANDSRK